MIGPRRGAAALLVLGLVIAGCSDSANGADAATDAVTDAVTTGLGPGEVRIGPEGEPWDFVHRDPLPSCGTLDTFPPEEDPPVSAEESCFRDAVGGDEGAELVRRGRTVEGDPIVDHYRALPGSTTVEVFSDSTADEFGAKVWSHRECTGLKERRTRVFEFDGCGEARTYLARQLTGRWADAGTLELRLRADGTWSGTDACDHGSGTFTVDEVGTFAATVDEREDTGGADCVADDALLDALEVAERAQVTADGTLTLHRSVRDLELVRLTLVD